MAQTWWDHCWELSEAIMRIQAFFQKYCGFANALAKEI